MSPRARLALFAPAALALAALLASALLQLPDFGHAGGDYGARAVDAALHDRAVSNTVAAVVFDIRALDTLGEELILFVTAIGCAVLLRARRSDERAQAAARRADEEAAQSSRSVRALSSVLVAPLLVLGIYVVAHGHLTPGGGFQGGVMLAGVLLLVFFAGRLLVLDRPRPIALIELAEAAGALAFALVAVGGLVFAAVALENFLPSGSLGELLSGGTIPLLQLAVGLEVAGAIALVLTELLDQAMLRDRGDE
jgi:multicomponent Na+:H+ antiporter subunit B